MNFVILAGGGGTRLWPLSRENAPKQFIKLFGEKTLIGMTYSRLKKLARPENIYIVANQKLSALAKKHLPQIPTRNYIIEPERRDTAPAFGLVCARLFSFAPDEPVAFIPADHFISNEKLFQESLKTAEELINKTGKLLDIAIAPAFPSTALGYTKIGKRAQKKGNIEIYEFLKHKEKPDIKKAKRYIKNGKYLWHAGYYMWTPRKFLEAFEKYAPTDYKQLKIIKNCFLKNKKNDKTNSVATAFKKMTKISIDYAITEKIRRQDVLIIKGEFGWSDVGAFDSLYFARKNSADENGNVFDGNFIGVESSRCLVYGQPKKLIAALGVNDLTIVDTPDALLICSQSRSQEIKKIKQITEKRRQ